MDFDETILVLSPFRGTGDMGGLEFVVGDGWCSEVVGYSAPDKFEVSIGDHVGWFVANVVDEVLKGLSDTLWF